MQRVQENAAGIYGIVDLRGPKSFCGVNVSPLTYFYPIEIPRVTHAHRTTYASNNTGGARPTRNRSRTKNNLKEASRK